MNKRSLFDISQEDLDAIWNAAQDTKPVGERRYTKDYLAKQQAEIERRGKLYGTIDLPDLSFGKKVTSGLKWLGKKIAGPFYPEKGIAPLTMPDWARAEDTAMAALGEANNWIQKNFLPTLSLVPEKVGEFTGKRIATKEEAWERLVDIPKEIKETWTTENIKQVPEHVGDVWAFIGTMMPGQESFPSKWKDLSPGQQILVSGQVASLVVLAYQAMRILPQLYNKAINFPTALRSARDYNNYLKRTLKQAGRKGRILEYQDWLAKEHKVLTRVVKMEVTPEESKLAAKEKRVPVATKKITEFREERIPSTSPLSQNALFEQAKERTPPYLENLVKKYANVEYVPRGPGLAELEKALNLQIRGIVPVSIPNPAIEQTAKELAKHFIPSYAPQILELRL